MCWCAVKKLLTHALTMCITVHIVYIVYWYYLPFSKISVDWGGSPSTRDPTWLRPYNRLYAAYCASEYRPWTRHWQREYQTPVLRSGLVTFRFVTTAVKCKPKCSVYAWRSVAHALSPTVSKIRILWFLIFITPPCRNHMLALLRSYAASRYHKSL